MKNNRIVDVTPWSPQATPVLLEEHAHRGFWSPTVVGLIGTLLLHTVVLQSALWGTRARRMPPPEMQRPGVTINKSSGAPAEILALIELPRTTHNSATELLEELPAANEARKKRLSTLISPDPSLLTIKINPVPIDEEAESIATDGGDGAERARLFGIYSGQMQARIDRVWRRPRTPVSEGEIPSQVPPVDEVFQCQVQIDQDPSGNVQKILLLHCNGSVGWQRSLILAIQQASPLPAPPSPSVFSRAITLNFVGIPYLKGSSDEDYEPLPFPAMQTALPNGDRGRAAVGTLSPEPNLQPATPGQNPILSSEP